MNPLRQANRLMGAMAALFWCLSVSSVNAQGAGEAVEPTVVVPQAEGLAGKTSLPDLEPQGVPGGLESLLRLPQGFVSMSPRSVAGVNEAQWRQRFQTAKTVLATAKQELEATKQELDGVALGGSASQWNVAPPGANTSNPSTSPLSFRLRQRLREIRERLEMTEKAMRELRIEANLAGVPASWRASN
ncbi:MAG: hypothetical protein VCB25_07770 [Myxococcota bacterium]